MKALTVYECEHCKKLFKKPNRHKCKLNPTLKNCWTCKKLKGWVALNDEDGCYRPTFYVDCECNDCELDLEQIKKVNYDLQCEHWEEGKYDWEEEFKKNKSESFGWW